MTKHRLLPGLLLSLLPGLPPGASLRASPWGVCAHPDQPREWQNIDTAINRVTQAGITWLREDIAFGKVYRHTGLAHPDLGYYDQLLEKLDAANIRMLAVLQGYDWEISRHHPEYTPLHAHPEAWRAFVRAVATRYKGRITHYEIWNEQDAGFWKPAPDAAQYVTLLKIAYQEIRHIDPGATIMAGGLTYWNAPYLADMYAAGAKGFFDALAVHPYGQGLDQNPRLRKQSADFRAILARHQDQHLPVWITEAGATSSEPAILHKNPALLPATLRHALTLLGQPAAQPVIGLALSPRSPDDPAEPQTRAWLPGVNLQPVPCEQLATLDPIKTPVLIGAERLHIDAPLLPPLQTYVERGGLLILAGMVPLYGTYQQRHDGSWTPAIDAPAETQSPFRLSFSAWWKDKTVPRTTTRVRTAPAALAAGIPALDRSFVDRVLRPDRLQPGDRYHPIITALDQEGQPVGEAMALYTYHDKKGGVLAICTPSGGEFTETAQGALLPRVYLGYLASGLNVQKIFWYDLHNDGPDPGEAEHNFGLLRQDWTPKPAHDACRAMTTALGKNPAFVKRIHTKDTNPEKTWALLFRRTEDNRHILAAWTTDPSAPFGIHAAGHSAAALAHIVNDTVLYCPVTDEQIPRLSIRRTN